MTPGRKGAKKTLLLLASFALCVFALILFSSLAGYGFQGTGGLDVHVIEVDFFDEAHCELVVDEEDLVAGVDARAEMLAHPPVTEVSENGDAGVRVGHAGGVWRQDGGSGSRSGQTTIRSTVALRIGELGTNARSAVPVLQEDSDRTLRFAVTNALMKIDPLALKTAETAETPNWHPGHP